MRLKQKDIKQYRLEQLKKQHNLCPLCNTVITPDEATLDHDHLTHKVRQVVHRSCNQTEGRIKSWIKRSRFNGDHSVFLQNLINYIQKDYSNNPDHPSLIVSLCKKFKLLSKLEQLQTLKNMNVLLSDKETKKSLLLKYKKEIKKLHR